MVFYISINFYNITSDCDIIVVCQKLMDYEIKILILIAIYDLIVDVTVIDDIIIDLWICSLLWYQNSTFLYQIVIYHLPIGYDFTMIIAAHMDISYIDIKKFFPSC